MRQIKFRAKEIDARDWIYGGGVQNIKDKTVMLSLENDMLIIYEIDPETVGQFTGLQDKNGVDIYEGDIVKGENYLFPCYDNRPLHIYWDEKSCGFKMHVFNKSEIKVIGNIHDK